MVMEERTRNSYFLSVEIGWSRRLVFWLLETLTGLRVSIKVLVMYREDVSPLVHLT
jgi:hypothetical protein